jgi:hypothetical protein
MNTQTDTKAMAAAYFGSEADVHRRKHAEEDPVYALLLNVANENLACGIPTDQDAAWSAVCEYEELGPEDLAQYLSLEHHTSESVLYALQNHFPLSQYDGLIDLLIICECRNLKDKNGIWPSRGERAKRIQAFRQRVADVIREEVDRQNAITG